MMLVSIIDHFVAKVFLSQRPQILQAAVAAIE
jgi:hypothetical protein